ncbi:MAG: PASTA domain-containing protein [Acidimicrobiaceae bacterium]|nr:PASTA domain-containing protein [Acidimicrobiaceae bacterium]MYI37069.1 PASTA domain-containing protein [Acidimicrobiaceae bacterium]
MSDVVPAQSFRINVDSDGSRWDEARHWLYSQPLDEVLDGHSFRPEILAESRALELLDRDGAVLESYPVYVQHVAVDPGPDYEQWEAVFQDPPDFASFRFVSGQRIVHEQSVSPNAPEVSFLGLEQDQVFASDAQFGFELLIDDGDGDDLELLILVSTDGGQYVYDRAGFFDSRPAGYEMLLSRLGPFTAEDYGSPLTVMSGDRTHKIPRIVAEGSEAVQLLAVVSDGARIGAVQSQVFVLRPFEAPAPTLQIRLMADGQVIGAGGPFDIGVRVTEEEYQHGDLRRRHIYLPQPVGGRALRWSSDIDGDITDHITPKRTSGGFKEIDVSPGVLRTVDEDDPSLDSGRLDASALTPGPHTLVAIFTADSGLQASDSIVVTILDSVSQGENPRVPQVRGFNRADATEILRRAGYEVIVIDSPYQAEAGTVIGQEPHSRAELAPGEAVTITVSTGPG